MRLPRCIVCLKPTELNEPVLYNPKTDHVVHIACEGKIKKEAKK